MTDPSFDRRFTAWLDERAQPRAPSGLTTDILERTARARPRPAWLIPERWFPMPTSIRLALMPRAAIVIVTSILLAALFAAIAVAAQPSVPPPIGLAHNGLVAFDSGDGSLYVADADGTHPRVFLDGENELRWPMWSPDGTLLAYFEMVATGPGRTDDQTLIHVVDATGQHDRDLTNGELLTPSISSNWQIDAAPGGSAWSPDSRWLALSAIIDGHPRIVVIATDGSGVTPVPLTLDAYDPSWSPIGDRLAFHAQEPNDDATTGVWTANPDGSDPIRVLAADGTGIHDLATDYSFSGPMWDPSGGSIVTFVLDDGTTDTEDHDLWVVGSNGSDPHRLLDDPTREWYPSWSPDGTLIGYQGFDADGKIDVRTLHPDGTRMQVLQVGPGNDGNGPLLWAPDGSAILTSTYGDATTDGRQTPRPTIVHLDPATPPTVIVDPGGARPAGWAEWIGLSWQRVS